MSIWLRLSGIISDTTILFGFTRGRMTAVGPNGFSVSAAGAAFAVLEAIEATDEEDWGSGALP